METNLFFCGGKQYFIFRGKWNRPFVSIELMIYENFGVHVFVLLLNYSTVHKTNKLKNKSQINLIVCK